jgi:hypothetical protein
LQEAKKPSRTKGLNEKQAKITWFFPRFSLGFDLDAPETPPQNEGFNSVWFPHYRVTSRF